MATLISEMALHSRKILSHVKRRTYTSEVAGKRYFGFCRSVDSRPVNEAIYIDDDAQFDGLLESFRHEFRNSPVNDVVQSVYTIAYSVFAANDVYEVGRKTSATFFEILVGHIVARPTMFSILGAGDEKFIFQSRPLRASVEFRLGFISWS